MNREWALDLKHPSTDDHQLIEAADALVDAVFARASFAPDGDTALTLARKAVIGEQLGLAVRYPGSTVDYRHGLRRVLDAAGAGRRFREELLSTARPGEVRLLLAHFDAIGRRHRLTMKPLSSPQTYQLARGDMLSDLEAIERALAAIAARKGTAVNGRYRSGRKGARIRRLKDAMRAVAPSWKEREETFQAALVVLAANEFETVHPPELSRLTGVPENRVRVFARRLGRSRLSLRIGNQILG
jgi:hypothetical protein